MVTHQHVLAHIGQEQTENAVGAQTDGLADFRASLADLGEWQRSNVDLADL